ncbi:esterase-like activity of phytase family protein [Paracoccus sp. CPCC 101403]|uniref:Esterase-like activity of phytase family protein n=1 Tax=Paracoccus broussonetiae TaxID=3075834 RepID=A0ABU3EFZ0_9RHOB|nr:esterase-like activity of phytase family protein [Paracoccus sp. CPCC 101403]MDT1063135.1 esterase-like activity of phytase family protein [Paracoccus sp. CPCC 101403]
MPSRRRRALSGLATGQDDGFRRPLGGIALAFLTVLATLSHSCAADPATQSRGVAPLVERVDTHVWSIDEPDFGGYSGLHLSEGGTRFIALSDRATLRWGRIERDPDGRILRVLSEGDTRIKDSEGRPLRPGWRGDSEGLAVGKDGKLWISYEGLTRVVSHDTPESPAHVLPRPEAFKQMQRNSSLESLAILPDGTLLTIPERSGGMNRPFPVWRFRDGAWDQPFSIPRRGDFLAVDADIGPDGRLYLLERDFMGLLGFRSRVRRFDLTPDGVTNEQELLVSLPLQYDNLEGMSVWQGPQGIMLTLISDDNFSRFQRTEFVEFRVVEQQPDPTPPAQADKTALQAD